MSRDFSTQQRTVEITALVHGPDTMLLRRDAGTATAGEEKWELAMDLGSGFPIVRGPDGRWVLFDWQALLAAASQALRAAGERWPSWNQLHELASSKPLRSGSRVRLMNLIDKIVKEHPDETVETALGPKRGLLRYSNAGKRTLECARSLVEAWRRQ